MRHDLEEMKQYLRIDGAEEDVLISSFIVSAESYIDSTGISFDTLSENAKVKYLLCIKLLVSHWYENRLTVREGSTEEIKFTLSNLINQLRWC